MESESLHLKMEQRLVRVIRVSDDTCNRGEFMDHPLLEANEQFKYCDAYSLGSTDIRLWMGPSLLQVWPAGLQHAGITWKVVRNAVAWALSRLLRDVCF